MRTRDRSETTELPAGMPERRAAGRIRLTVEQRRAVKFLRSRTGTAAKILVGDPATGKTTLLNKICAELQGYTVLRTSGAAGATGSFMISLLHSAGLLPDHLSGPEQESLLIVFLEHQAAKGRRVLIAVDGAEKLSSEDWSELERLHTLQLENSTSFELIIAGRPDIYRQIRSPVDGWHCARTRFHVLRGIEDRPVPDVAEEPEQLIITRDGETIDRASLKVRTLIGRNVHNDICLQHASVSRHHAVIIDTPGGYYVVDLSSKNGLVVNGEQVTSAVLRNTDVMILGPYRLKVVARGDTGGDPRPGSPSLSATATMRVKNRPGNGSETLQRLKTAVS